MASKTDERSHRGKSLIDREALLNRLPPIEYKPGDDADDRDFEQASLARALLNLVEVDQEREHTICQSVARHLLGEVPGPDDFEQ